MTTLLVDGDNLLTIGFYGAKNYFHKGRHFGGTYHFLNSLRKMFEVYNLDKIVVFWDGEDASNTRRSIYEHYKTNRIDRKSEQEKSDYNYQRNRIKKYLEEIYVRQGEFKYCETDDCIAYYVQNSPKENKIIYSSDGDLTQLLSENTKIYSPNLRKELITGEIIDYHHELLMVDNIKIVKILCGDPSDNISGIKGLGLKRLLAIFPELRTRKFTIDEIIHRSSLLLETTKESAAIKNLLTGVTKYGVFGDEFFEINKKIVILDNPLLTKEAREDIFPLIYDVLDPDGRSFRNIMKMMMEDGLFSVLPKNDNAWVNFLNPFLRLTRKEKNKKY